MFQSGDFTQSDSCPPKPTEPLPTQMTLCKENGKGKDSVIFRLQGNVLSWGAEIYRTDASAAHETRMVQGVDTQRSPRDKTGCGFMVLVSGTACTRAEAQNQRELFVIAPSVEDKTTWITALHQSVVAAEARALLRPEDLAEPVASKLSSMEEERQAIQAAQQASLGRLRAHTMTQKKSTRKPRKKEPQKKETRTLPSEVGSAQRSDAEARYVTPRSNSEASRLETCSGAGKPALV